MKRGKGEKNTERTSTEKSDASKNITFPRFPATTWTSPGGHWITSKCEAVAVARSWRSRGKRKRRPRRGKRRANNVRHGGTMNTTQKRESIDLRSNKRYIVCVIVSQSLTKGRANVKLCTRGICKLLLDRRTQWKRYQRLYHRFSDDNYIINLLDIRGCRFVNDTSATDQPICTSWCFVYEYLSF